MGWRHNSGGCAQYDGKRLSYQWPFKFLGLAQAGRLPVIKCNETASGWRLAGTWNVYRSVTWIWIKKHIFALFVCGFVKTESLLIEGRERAAIFLFSLYSLTSDVFFLSCSQTVNRQPSTVKRGCGVVEKGSSKECRSVRWNQIHSGRWNLES